MKLLFYFFLTITLNNQVFNNTQDDYTIWYNRMKNNIYLKEIVKVNYDAKTKIDDGYFGNDIDLLKTLDVNCYKSESDLIKCLKSVGFKRSEEYSKNVFSRINLFSKFVKENPDFYKLNIETRKKLLKQFSLDNLLQPIFI